MINLSTERNKFIIVPNVPTGTSRIDYNVYVDGVLTFVGSSKYFGDDGCHAYHIDISDYIETKILSDGSGAGGLSDIAIRVEWSYDGVPTQVSYYTWSPDTISSTYLPPLNTNNNTFIALGNCPICCLSGNQRMHLDIPLKVYNGYVVGKTINTIDKITYINKYGDSYNGGASNSFEIECYMDSDSLNVTTNNDMIYEKVIMALQTAGVSYLNLDKGPTSIKGIERPNSLYQRKVLWGKVKDVEKVELYSRYNTTNKVPSLKITYEIYNVPTYIYQDDWPSS